MPAHISASIPASAAPPKRPSITPVQMHGSAPHGLQANADIDELELRNPCAPPPSKMAAAPTTRLPPPLLSIKKQNKLTEAPLARFLALRIVQQNFDDFPDIDPEDIEDIEEIHNSLWQGLLQQHRCLTLECLPGFFKTDIMVITQAHVQKLTARLVHPKQMPHYLYWLFQSPTGPKNIVAYTPLARYDLLHFLEFWGLDSANKFILTSRYQKIWDRWREAESDTLLSAKTLRVIDAVIEAVDDEDSEYPDSPHSSDISLP